MIRSKHMVFRSKQKAQKNAIYEDKNTVCKMFGVIPFIKLQNDI